MNLSISIANFLLVQRKEARDTVIAYKETFLSKEKDKEIEQNKKEKRINRKKKDNQKRRVEGKKKRRQLKSRQLETCQKSNI